MNPITEECFDRAKEDLDVALEIISKEHLTNMVAFHFDSVKDPAEWQQRVRHDWEENAV